MGEGSHEVASCVYNVLCNIASIVTTDMLNYVLVLGLSLMFHVSAFQAKSIMPYSGWHYYTFYSRHSLL